MMRRTAHLLAALVLAMSSLALQAKEAAPRAATTSTEKRLLAITTESAARLARTR